MKSFLHIFTSAISRCLVAAVAVASLAACDDDPELPPVNPPTVEPSVKANTTILDLKTTYWSSERNYADTVGLTPSGERTIIAGRVISSDSTGNIYKSLIIQDATAAMAISLDSTKIYQRYPVGEEVYIDMTGMNVGKYNGLFQMGTPKPYNSTYEISFMPYWQFNTVAQRNGLPEVSRIDTVTTTIERILSWTRPDSIIRYQSQLIRLDNVEFTGGGRLTWADNGANANRQLRDTNGRTLTVRNSGYASFGRDVMPAGRGTVVCILSYYGTGWQLLFRSALDCHDFSGTPSPDEPSQPTGSGDGSMDKPFEVGQVTGGAQGTDVWVTGYIVGWVEGASISEGAHFDSNATSQSNILIAASPDVKSVDACVPVQLVSNTDVRKALNLKDNPSNLHRQVSIKGNLETYFNVKGLKGASLYNWGDKGAPDNPSQPDEPSATAVFRKVTKVTSGGIYVMVTPGGKMALPLEQSSTYGYLKVAAVTVEGDSLQADRADAFTFTAVKGQEGQFTMTDTHGRYYIMKGTFNSFNVDTTASEGSAWTVTATDDGTVKVTNVEKGKTVQYSSQYDSFGVYTSLDNELPILYELSNSTTSPQ